MITESFSLTVIAILFIVLLWFLFEEIWDFALFAKRSHHKEVVNLSTLRAMSIFKHHEDIVAVDVRPVETFRKRRLPDAVSAPYEEGTLDVERLAGLDREKPILVYCDGGFRSRQSLDAFVDEGFTKIFHLNRGFLAWKFYGGPTETGETAVQQ